uniref:Flocculation protein FLO11-like n=1 Tax=Haemonchus contortus TaxID=6289 RepID=A0A7I4Y6Z3_HAECO
MLFLSSSCFLLLYTLPPLLAQDVVEMTDDPNDFVTAPDAPLSDPGDPGMEENPTFPSLSDDAAAIENEESSSISSGTSLNDTMSTPESIPPKEEPQKAAADFDAPKPENSSGPTGEPQTIPGDSEEPNPEGPTGSTEEPQTASGESEKPNPEDSSGSTEEPQTASGESEKPNPEDSSGSTEEAQTSPGDSETASPEEFTPSTEDFQNTSPDGPIQSFSDMPIIDANMSEALDSNKSTAATDESALGVSDDTNDTSTTPFPDVARETTPFETSYSPTGIAPGMTPEGSRPSPTEGPTPKGTSKPSGQSDSSDSDSTHSESDSVRRITFFFLLAIILLALIFTYLFHLRTRKRVAHKKAQMKAAMKRRRMSNEWPDHGQEKEITVVKFDTGVQKIEGEESPGGASSQRILKIERRPSAELAYYRR